LSIALSIEWSKINCIYSISRVERGYSRIEVIKWVRWGRRWQRAGAEVQQVIALLVEREATVESRSFKVGAAARAEDFPEESLYKKKYNEYGIRETRPCRRQVL
jgi:hypothetical protein